ncbi:uncharacterized protein BCR38DRAFT_486521 [Pseudomassariella vexata]|uniref:Cyanovirin-N domain-containing protein n=1 Tax=Pseudomassariella vexata TaxID=1141098 RepID=A0A1Y2DSV8_9PEZI|nr:uncharacterized protein BCR38DRAFT_486521 [Pseudomassariella vexata]ORY62249.1 hypothetical protein BCR38DRAFT_486521 [Pseudomassariella vexata]
MKFLITIVTLVVTLLGLANHASAQGFVSNCTWQGANLTGSFLGMYCNDNDWAEFHYMWTWFDLGHCMLNNGGSLAAYDNGQFYGSCHDCSFRGSNTDFQFACLCSDIDGNLKNSSYDINRIVWNHNGTLGCYGWQGNQSSRP